MKTKKNIDKAKVFIRYLKENGLFKQFTKNFDDINQKNIRQTWLAIGTAPFYTEPNLTFKDYCSKARRTSCLFIYAFDWSKTPQGHRFWETESSKFIYYCSKMGF